MKDPEDMVTKKTYIVRKLGEKHCSNKDMI